MPPAMQGFTNFNPETDIPSLKGKVILITGGTFGLGAESVRALAAHNPSHIYFSGRNITAANTLIKSTQATHPSVGLTFIPLDLSSLATVKPAIQQHFTHPRLDILINNAGIMAQPPSLSPDGFEIQFATNHLGHAMLTRTLLPILSQTASRPDSDVRILTLTSEGYMFHPPEGISFAELDAGSTMQRWALGPWVRYGHSKLAGILYSAELARRYPGITSVSVHPGVVKTSLLGKSNWANRWLVHVMCWWSGIPYQEVRVGAWNQLWCAAGAEKGELVSGAYYTPVGWEVSEMLSERGRDEGLSKKLWEWTEGVLDRF